MFNFSTGRRRTRSRSRRRSTSRSRRRERERPKEKDEENEGYTFTSLIILIKNCLLTQNSYNNRLTPKINNHSGSIFTHLSSQFQSKFVL
jgi:hypothetical protein